MASGSISRASCMLAGVLFFVSGRTNGAPINNNNDQSRVRRQDAPAALELRDIPAGTQ